MAYDEHTFPTASAILNNITSSSRGINKKNKFCETAFCPWKHIVSIA